MPIEQAIFTSCRTERTAGYQLVAHSSGVSGEEAKELAAWGPSHDSLLEGGESINFHRLASGRFCVSKTSEAGREYSGRSGPRIYTQLLIVGPEDLARFGNNPFGLLRAATAHGYLEVRDDVPTSLMPFRLVGRSAEVDQRLLKRLTAFPGGTGLGAVLDGLLSERSVGLIGPANQRRSVVDGLLNCLPVALRPQFSFSTGLKPSTARSFNLIFLPPDAREQKLFERSQGGRVLNLTSGLKRPRLGGWGQLVQQAFETDRIPALAEMIGDQGPELSPAELDALGEELLPKLKSATSGRNRPLQGSPSRMQALEELAAKLYRRPDDEQTWELWRRAHAEILKHRDRRMGAELVRRACQVFGGKAEESPERVQRVAELLESQLETDEAIFEDTRSALAKLPEFDGRSLWLSVAGEIAKRQRLRTTENRNKGDAKAPRGEERPVLAASHTARGWVTGDKSAGRNGSRGLSPARANAAASAEKPQIVPPVAGLDPAAVERLEKLDDVVFEAITGNDDALEELKAIWPKMLAELGQRGIEESREQYMRRALAVWQECVEGNKITDPAKAIRTMDVIIVLLTE